MLKKIILLLCFATLVVLIYIFAYPKPTNNKIWVPGMEKQANITINEEEVVIKILDNGGIKTTK